MEIFPNYYNKIIIYYIFTLNYKSLRNHGYLLANAIAFIFPIPKLVKFNFPELVTLEIKGSGRSCLSKHSSK